jgi:hypothetical protein
MVPPVWRAADEGRSIVAEIRHLNAPSGTPWRCFVNNTNPKFGKGEYRPGAAVAGFRQQRRALNKNVENNPMHSRTARPSRMRSAKCETFDASGKRHLTRRAKQRHNSRMRCPRPGAHHTRIAFVRDAQGKVSGFVLNPGPWEQNAAMIAPGPK